MTVAESNFKVGDKVVVTTSVYDVTVSQGESKPPKKGAILEVVERCTSADKGVWIDDKTVEVETINEPWQAGDFALYVEPVTTKKFQVGDKVISVKDTPEVPEGFVGYIVEDELDPKAYGYAVKGKYVSNDVIEYFKEDELELLSVNQSSIARPVLEERKVGKVQMDLFDSGFPNAITEVAKVMTWAAENKGYKPHDWKGLPNAETEFSAAASRHRVKGFIQKAEGVPAFDRTDEESNIVHLAHAVFNILAELELVLTGKIK